MIYFVTLVNCFYMTESFNFEAKFLLYIYIFLYLLLGSNFVSRFWLIKLYVRQWNILAFYKEPCSTKRLKTRRQSVHNVLFTFLIFFQWSVRVIGWLNSLFYGLPLSLISPLCWDNESKNHCTLHIPLFSFSFHHNFKMSWVPRFNVI